MSITGQTRLNATSPLRHVQMLIAGAWADSASGQTLDDAATQAFLGWSKTPPRDRGDRQSQHATTHGVTR